MFEITGVGTFLLSLAATVGVTVASVKLGPRLVFEGRRAVLGVLGRVGLVVLSWLFGLVTALLVFNWGTGSVSSYSEIGEFFNLLGLYD